ncbi:MAG: TetR/AcrR family transcriptional regulator [Pleomorphochaeta sp.]
MDNKTNILNCALNLFSQKGFEGVSVQQLVNEAKITKPTLYYYYKSKEGLYNKLLDNYYTELNNQLKSISNYTPNPNNYHEDIYPVLDRIINTYFTYAKNNPQFYRIILSNQYMPKSSPIYEMSHSFDNIQYQIILDTFTNMANVHTNLKKNVTKLTWSFIGLINTYIGLFLQDNSFELSSNLSKELVHQFMHGIHA